MRLQKRWLSVWSLVLLLAASGCDDAQPERKEQPTETSKSAGVEIPSLLSFDLVREYPHDPAAFTEGLEYRDGILYESTGQYGASDVRQVDLETGKVLRATKMENRYFGEGLTVLNGKVYQLTYREGKAFVYDAATLKPEGSFMLNIEEGWGMTNNGSELIFDDGGSTIYFVNAETHNVRKTITVTDEHGPVKMVNELELINGYLYANKWQTDMVLKIDTTSGRVVARADLGPLRMRAGIAPVSGRPGAPEVMNGIAYDAAKNKIFITGKYWPKLLEIRLDN